MKQNRLKSVFAFLLAVLMAVTTMFSPLTGLTAKAENEIDVQLSLKEVNASNRWEFNWTLPDGESFAEGFYRVETTVDGVTRNSLVEYDVYNNGSKHLFIYSHCFNSAALNTNFIPKTSFSIAKDAVLIPVVTNQWGTEDTSRSRFKLTKAFAASKNAETSAWEQEVVTNNMTLSFVGVDTNNNWKFTPAVAGGKTMAKGWYRVQTSVDGVSRESLLEYTGTSTYIYGHCFHSAALNVNNRPKESFVIAENAILIPVVTNQWTTEDTTREAYKVTQNFTVNYNTTTAAWEQVIPTIDVKLALNSVSTSQTWDLQYTFASNESFGVGFYKVPATVDGESREVLVEYMSNGKLDIWASFFTSPPTNNKYPTENFSIAADAIMIPVVTSSWDTEDTTRSRYKVTDTFSVTYNANNSQWEEAGAQQAAPIDISLDLMLVDSANNNWKFNFTVAAGSEFATGWYKVPATVDGESRDVLMEYAVYQNGNTQLYIYGHCFNATPTNGKYPKSSFSIAEDAILTSVVANDWGTEDTARSKYKLTEAFSATYNTEASAWEEAGSQIEVTTLNISSVSSWSAETVFPMKIGNQNEVAATRWHSEINTANKPTWKRVQGTVDIDGEDTQITIDFPGNGEMFFNISSSGKDKMIIKADTLFQATNGNFRVKFDKDYEVYISERLVYEEGQRPAEKEPISMHMIFNKVANGTFDFKYSSDVEGHPVANQFYHVTAIIDGVEKEILVETGGKSGLLYIYEHCFASAPNKNSTPPTSNIKFEAGALFYPVDRTTWSKNIGAQTYTLDEEVSVILVENAWMDEGYYNQISSMEPLEVEVKLNSAKGKALRLDVVTASGKTIEEIYGDWTTAYGPIKRGVLNEQGEYEFTTEASALYSLTKEYFYFDTIALGDLDALQIEAGTIVYPADGCKSMQPMKIMNNFGIVRDAKDKWVLDEDFTTDYPGLDFKATATGTTSGSAGNKSTTEVVAGATVDTSTTTSSKDAKDTNKGVILRGDVEDERSVFLPGTSNNTVLFVGGIAIVILLCAGIVIFLLLKKRRKDQQEE